MRIDWWSATGGCNEHEKRRQPHTSLIAAMYAATHANGKTCGFPDAGRADLRCAVLARCFMNRRNISVACRCRRSATSPHAKSRFGCARQAHTATLRGRTLRHPSHARLRSAFLSQPCQENPGGGRAPARLASCRMPFDGGRVFANPGVRTSPGICATWAFFANDII